MDNYDKLMEKIGAISELLHDSIVVRVDIKNGAYWVDLKSTNGESIEQKDGLALASTCTMFNGKIGEGSTMQEDIAASLSWHDYVYCAYCNKRYEFSL